MRLLEIPIHLNKEQAEKKVGEKDAILTCYLKDNTEGKPAARRKAVIICPGGGYEFCSTREAEPVAMQFLAMDCQVFVLRYSTAPSRFPTALMELFLAVAMVRDRAGEWCVDSKKTVVCGFSAGGHLAACLGVFWNRDFLLRPLGLSEEQVRPDGLILSYPVISSGEFAHRGSFDNLLGTDKLGNGPTENGREECAKQEGEKVFSREFLSLEHMARPHMPPVFMWHSDKDDSVPVENSLLFSLALKKAGVSLELHIFSEGRHGLALANEETDKDMEDGRGPFVVPCCQNWIPLVREWLKRLDFPNIS